MFPFLLFSLFFALLFYLHFAVAHRSWSRIRGQISGEVNMAYVRLEDYFGQSFRTLMQGWLKLPTAPGSTATLRIIDRGRERVFISSSATYPDMRRETEVLSVQGDFACGSRCDFRKELYVRNNCDIGPYTRLQAIAVDGNLTLGYGSEVRRWVDVTGSVNIEEEVSVRAKVTSRTGILLGSRARAASLFAPEIVTEGRRETAGKYGVTPRNVIQIPHPDGAPPQAAHGYDPSLLRPMGGDSCAYDGDLVLKAPLHLRKPLVVRGRFSCPPESLLEADVKARGSIDIGATSVVQANLVSDMDIRLGPDCFFQGVLQAHGSIRLSRGVRGLREEIPVSAYSGGPLFVESNVVVNGKLASADRVEAVPTPVAWLDQQYPLKG